jgi:hypothetical protein
MAKKKASSKAEFSVPEELGKELFKVTITELIKRIRAGEASPTDLATAARICKDNGIEIEVTPLPAGEGVDLSGDLPDFDD